MTLQEIENKMTTIRKGAITKVHYLTTKNGYTKETQTCVRFVKYANIKGVVPSGKTNPNEQKTNNEFVIYNANTQKYYLQMATIKTNHKAQVSYYYQGNPITKQEYEMANPPRPTNGKVPPVIRKDIADIVSIG